MRQSLAREKGADKGRSLERRRRKALCHSGRARGCDGHSVEGGTHGGGRRSVIEGGRALGGLGIREGDLSSGGRDLLVS